MKAEPLRTVIDSDPLRAVMDGMLQHPKFDDAAKHYLDNILAWRREMGLFNRVATNAGMHVVAYMLFLHYINETGLPENGATFSRLLEICESRGNCSSRALRTILVLMHLLGYIDSELSSTDKRLRIYTPTEKLLTQTRRQYTHIFECTDLLAPGANSATAARFNPNFFPQLFATSGRAFIDKGIVVAEYFPDLQTLMQLHGGFPTFAKVTDSELRQQPFPSAHSIAKEFKISSSQVRAVLKAAEEHGLLTLGERGVIVDARPLSSQHKAMIARELAIYAKYSLGLENYFQSKAGPAFQQKVANIT